jgi:hypothetical protein
MIPRENNILVGALNAAVWSIVFWIAVYTLFTKGCR